MSLEQKSTKELTVTKYNFCGKLSLLKWIVLKIDIKTLISAFVGEMANSVLIDGSIHVSGCHHAVWSKTTAFRSLFKNTVPYQLHMVIVMPVSSRPDRWRCEAIQDQVHAWVTTSVSIVTSIPWYQKGFLNLQHAGIYTAPNNIRVHVHSVHSLWPHQL